MIFAIMKKIFYCILFISVLISCKPDREFEEPSETAPIGNANNILPGTIRVNEFVTVGSVYGNELDSIGSTSDWLELYNTTNDTIFFANGEWTLTDSIGWFDKWVMPDTFISPKGFLVVWCDDLDTTITQLHASFKLSSGGEDIGLYYKKSGTVRVAVDEFTYTQQSAATSQARYPDGSTNWIISANPSLELPNLP
jgi:hypothetical protein